MSYGDVLLEFTVHGDPKPQGSKVVMPNRQVRESSKALPDWRRAVGQRAGDAMDGRPPLDEPVVLDALFYLKRPAGHYGTGRNAGVLKSSSPAAPTTMPDLDKLLRAICDAMTSVVWRSDALVVAIRAGKRYADGRATGAEIVVRAAGRSGDRRLPSGSATSGGAR